MDWGGDAEARLLEYIDWSTFAFTWSYGAQRATEFFGRTGHSYSTSSTSTLLLTLSCLLTRVPVVTDYGVCPLVERLFVV